MVDDDLLVISSPATRKGNWMLSYQGNKIHPFDLQPSDIDIIDIAHALSNICRFGGHCLHFYSVAQHSTIVASRVPMHLAKAALLHDATEAYCGDMVRPLKVQMPEFQEIEKQIWLAICWKFDIDPDLDELIEFADAKTLITEKRDLTTNKGHVWEFPQCKYPDIEPYHFQIFPQNPETAKETFMLLWENVK